MFAKVLVANRAEIAVRAFRAAFENGARTVAVFPHEDRMSEHRVKADEAYQIGEEGHPVKAYLDIESILEVAKQAGADAIYPGYGFLSENVDFARRCAEEGVTFIGPPPEVLAKAGDKVAALKAARDAGVPVLDSSEPSRDPEFIIAEADRIGYPVFVKAVAGGGGRGMRRVERPEDLPELLASAMREAENAFGDPTVFLEQAVLGPRHIEVQILADAEGNVIHLFERDCSVQRRHQKVIEIAPAPALDPAIRDALCADAVKFATSLGYVNAGTVEFLVATEGERAGQHVFIEMNPRIQVEHTVTEEVTGVDLVSSQMRIASGETLEDLGLRQDNVRVTGFAVQTRVTTEDPANGFLPDTGRIVAYRSPGGAGVRLDGATGMAGNTITGHFDSMLVKLTCRGYNFETAITRAERALAEFRIRGVTNNIKFLRNVLSSAEFRAGGVTTAFIDQHPELLQVGENQDRSSKLLAFLGHTTVNRPHGEHAEAVVRPGDKLPAIDLEAEPPAGSRQRLLELGPEGFAKALREQEALAVTETTMRDAHQSLLATRVRTYDLLAAAGHTARMTPELLSVECWGGATYDVSMRFLSEDPWIRLTDLRAKMPNIALQMLLRGRNTVGYTPYPDEVAVAFVEEAAATGIDIFRIFDALNDVEQMRPAIEAVRGTGTAIAEATLCYTGNMISPEEKLYTLDYYLNLADSLVEAGAHMLAIKDMAGLLRPAAAYVLVSELRKRFDLPIHLHTHDTAGGQIGTLLAAAEAGVDAVDVANAAMAGTTSQPPMSALVAALEHTQRDTGIALAAAQDLEPYWESVRRLYSPFESGLPGPTGRVYHHEIPGGQLSNLRQQAISLGLADKFEAIEDMYAAANRILGNLVKVTPSSKVVGDLALHLVANDADPADFEENPDKYDLPDSVIGFLAGELGDPPGGWPEPFRSKALQGRDVTRTLPELSEDDREVLAVAGPDRRRRLNHLLFPGPAKEFDKAVDTYGDISVIDTFHYLYGLTVGSGEEAVIELHRGVRIIATIEAVGEPDDHGERTVIFNFNGQIRPIQVRDLSAKIEVVQREKADASKPGHIASPFTGLVTPRVSEGDQVEAGQTVAVIEAMKMESSITTPVAGTVARVVIDSSEALGGGDLVLVVE
ncbi:pyruvate carboxylase [Demequina sp. SYSU T00039]|uniref:Pyruvate carboxylase n=1 Tax=Demequina lignilytica TaxID=3051663 RepID=A0AAW7M0I2_9MICO|nr:pyruvate carboxylase [Demequina sp. SYSU T00039]MDN4486659.1 pyruvate carboxylase [Demequina sp. SYSU T00039]